MREASPFVGREPERAALLRWLAEARAGRGRLALVSGEAGIGKSRLVREALREGGASSVIGAGSQGDGTPYGPVVQVLRDHLRRSGHDSRALGPLGPHLAVLVPELGTPPRTRADRGTLFEAIRCAFARMAAVDAVAVLLDDLHWADEATIEFLPVLADGLGEMPLLVVGAYRTEEILREHPFRRFRAELRRKGHLREIRLEPLSLGETKELATHILGGSPSPGLAAGLHGRSQGVPFYVEELAADLAGEGILHPGPRGLEVPQGREAPLPESIRDAVLLRTSDLTDAGRRALEAASVLGSRFELTLAERLAGGSEALSESFDRGLLVEGGPGEAAFRHALIREAVYGGMPRSRQWDLHGQTARELEARGAPAALRAFHWLAAREQNPARRALLQSVEASCRVHAFRDALRAAQQALGLWPEGEDEPGRLALVDRMARCAELSGDLAEAVRAWTEVAEGRNREGNLYELAQTRRRLAAVHGLQGDWEGALEAHRDAADAFARHGLPGEAAAERLMAAEQLEVAGGHRAALELVRASMDEASRGGRTDLEALALGLEGQLRVGLGELDRGLELVRAGLNLALAHDLAPAAADLHYRLAWALGEAGEYGTARGAYEAGLEYCQARGVTEVEQQCLVCYAGVLFEVGEWNRASTICRELLEAHEGEPVLRVVATCILGLLEGLRGRVSSARGLLLQVEEGQLGIPSSLALELTTLWGLAVVDGLEGRVETTAERIRRLRARWAETDDRYYVVHPLRWAVTFLAEEDLEAEARACTDVLATVAATKASPEALAALAHALGECALLDGDSEGAVGHFRQALRLLGRLGLPFQHAHTRVRAAAALARAGDGEEAARHLAEAYRTAHRMGAGPLAHRAVRGLEELGESLERRLGRRAAHRVRHGGLTPRELQVLGLVGRGRSNRAIARALFLSPRTVEMHVSNALLKLDCSNRTEAVHRARERGVLT